MRSSSYGTHQMCEMRYFIEYGLGWTGRSGVAAVKGTVVHKIMELIAYAQQSKQKGEGDFFDKEIGITLDIDNLDVEGLFEKVYQFYITAASHLKWTPKDRRESLKWTHMCLDFQDGYFDPRKTDIIEPEQFFNIEIKEDWAKYEYEKERADGSVETIEGNLSIKGTIDLVTKVNENTYELVDYKTGARKDWNKTPPTVKEYEDLLVDPQLRMYHFACSCLYPQIENIYLTIYFVKDGGPFTLFFCKSQIPETLEIIRAKFEEIKKTTRPARNRSFKCKTFCDCGKTTFEGTSIKPLVEKRRGQIANKGEFMTKCDQVDYALNHRTMKSIMKYMSAPDFDIDYYQAPGST
jgi:hypothetical protein